MCRQSELYWWQLACIDLYLVLGLGAAAIAGVLAGVLYGLSRGLRRLTMRGKRKQQ